MTGVRFELEAENPAPGESELPPKLGSGDPVDVADAPAPATIGDAVSPPKRLVMNEASPDKIPAKETDPMKEKKRVSKSGIEEKSELKTAAGLVSKPLRPLSTAATVLVKACPIDVPRFATVAVPACHNFRS